MRRAPQDGRSLWARLAHAWLGPGGETRTRPILIASVCSGILGFTAADVLGINLLLAYALTVVAVFLITTLVLVWRG